MKKRVFVWVVGVLILAGCANMHPDRTAVARKYHHAVMLETREPAAASMFAHPCRLEADVLKNFMGRLVAIGETGIVSQPTPLPVFQEDEIERLVPDLQQALAQAGPDQCVRFVSFKQGKGLVFSSSRKSEGVLFASSDGQLNLAMNYINAKRLPSETSALCHEYSKIDPLKIRKAETPFVVTGAGLAFHRFADGARAPMWLEVDMKQMEKTMVSQARRPLLSREEKTPAMVAPSAVSATTGQPFDNIRLKLMFLKKLFDERLISPEEYHAKKAQVLADLD
ncbi:hypothetical protein [Desulfuromonas thiophila]|uniref:hypothetical protein n=1 Tax=Desulfuromonas thiophila TaxID=57664 RepID=UPI0029F4DFF3|nr:hypothetical protein [Desulfuromonas thiophila]